MAGQLVRTPPAILPPLVFPTSGIESIFIHETRIFILLEYCVLSLGVHCQIIQDQVMALSSRVICPVKNSEGTKESITRSTAKYLATFSHV